MRPATGRPPGARAVRRVLLVIIAAAVAAGIIAVTASTATARVGRPAAPTVISPLGYPSCQPWNYKPPFCHPV